MSTIFKWIDGPAWHLMVQTQAGEYSFNSTNEFLGYVKTSGAEWSSATLELAGCLVYGLALREYGGQATRQPLHAAEKALDSFYPIMSRTGQNEHFQRGMARLKEHLFPFRSEDYSRLVTRLLRFMEAEYRLEVSAG